MMKLESQRTAFVVSTSMTRLVWLFIMACLFNDGGPVAVVEAQEQSCDARTGRCDTHERCPIWAVEGECRDSRRYMMEHCPGSCAAISQQATSNGTPSRSSGNSNKNNKEPPCVDKLERCALWADLGECEENPEHMHKNCPLSCNVCDQVQQQDEADDNDNEPEFECRDLHEKCKLWAEKGECDKNSKWMHKNCGKACDTCFGLLALVWCCALLVPRTTLSPATDDLFFRSNVFSWGLFDLRWKGLLRTHS